MDAMKKAIMKRRMKLADMGGDDMEEGGLLDHGDMKKDNMNPASGSEDDADLAEMKAEKMDGLAPDVMGEEKNYGNTGDVEMEIEMEKQTPEGKMEMEVDPSVMEKLFVQDDVGKPGIKGKVASKLMAAMKKIKA